MDEGGGALVGLAPTMSLPVTDHRTRPVDLVNALDLPVHGFKATSTMPLLVADIWAGTDVMRGVLMSLDDRRCREVEVGGIQAVIEGRPVACVGSAGAICSGLADAEAGCGAHLTTGGAGSWNWLPFELKAGGGDWVGSADAVV